MHFATIGARFTPPETPNVGSTFAAFHGHTLPACMSSLFSCRELLFESMDMPIERFRTARCHCERCYEAAALGSCTPGA